MKEMSFVGVLDVTHGLILMRQSGASFGKRCGQMMWNILSLERT
jgi:hypothetical protein